LVLAEVAEIVLMRLCPLWCIEVDSRNHKSEWWDEVGYNPHRGDEIKQTLTVEEISAIAASLRETCPGNSRGAPQHYARSKRLPVRSRESATGATRRAMQGF
jgi:hypothetical protein